MPIRTATRDDAEAIAAIYNQGIAERRSTFETQPRGTEEIREKLGVQGLMPYLVATDADGTVLGWANISCYRPRLLRRNRRVLDLPRTRIARPWHRPGTSGSVDCGSAPPWLLEAVVADLPDQCGKPCVMRAMRLSRGGHLREACAAGRGVAGRGDRRASDRGKPDVRARARHHREGFLSQWRVLVEHSTDRHAANRVGRRSQPHPADETCRGCGPVVHGPSCMEIPTTAAGCC
jgi:hypothetical protein